MCYRDEELRGRRPAISPGQTELLIKNEADLEGCFKRYYPAICRYLCGILHCEASAEDIAQEAFIKLCLTPPADRGNLGAWLFRVATNLAYNYLRSVRIRGSKENRLEGEIYPDTAEEILIRREEILMVKQVLDSLGDRDRICLIMKFSGFSYEEISRAAGIKKSSVGTTIARAQARFRDSILKVKGSDAGVL